MRVLEVKALQVELMTGTSVVESGSGKSTTAMAILRLLPDDLAVISGEARISGQDVTGDRAVVDKLRGRAVALIPQDPMTALSPIRTIGRQMTEAVRIRYPDLGRAGAKAR